MNGTEMFFCAVQNLQNIYEKRSTVQKNLSEKPFCTVDNWPSTVQKKLSVPFLTDTDTDTETDF